MKILMLKMLKTRKMMSQNYLVEALLEGLRQVFLQEVALQVAHLEAALLKAHLEAALLKVLLEEVHQKAPQEVDRREDQESHHHPLLNQVVHREAHQKAQVVARLQEALQKDQNEALQDEKIILS